MKIEYTNKRKATGITAVFMELTEPAIKTGSVAVNQINIFVGPNGTGKSFLLVTTYAMTNIANIVVMGKPNPAQLVESAQFVIDNCFDCKDITGEFGADFDLKASVRVKMDNGRVQFVDLFGFENITEVTPVKFMSAGMRTFNAIKSYLVIRGMLSTLTEEQRLLELLKSFKLYDITYLEHLIAKMPLKVDQTLQTRLETFDDKLPKIDHFGVDLVKNDFYCSPTGSADKKYLTSFGSGHQSLFNMILGSV